MSVKTILYAEDNPDDVIIFKMAFKRAKLSATLRCVDDGECAIEWLEGKGEFADRAEHPLPDLLILDLKMPRKSGFDVLEWLKTTHRFPNLPVLVLSSSDDPNDMQRAADLGAVQYFKKTASSKEIIQYLGTIS